MPPPRLILFSLALLTLLAASTHASASPDPADSRLVHHPRRHPSHALLQARQFQLPPFGGGGGSSDTPAPGGTATTPAPTNPAAGGTTPAPAATSSSSRGGLDILSGIIPGVSSSSSAPASSSDTRSSSSSARSSSSSVLPSISASSALLPPLASASGSPETTKNNDSGGGGIGKGTLIAVIVIASCVGGVAAIWTVIRKWKFSPSKRFEDKLQPIDFGPLGKKGDGVEASSQVNLMATSDKLNRSNSGKTEHSDSYHRHEPAAWQTPYMTPHQHHPLVQVPYGHAPAPMHQPYGAAGYGPAAGYGGAGDYYPPPAAPYASQALNRGDSWRTGAGRY